MWGEVEPGKLTVLNDFGVGWNHNSTQFVSSVRFPQLCDSPVASWPVSGDTLGEGGSGTRQEPLGVADPLARELYVGEDLRSQATASDYPSSPAEAWAQSVLYVHEPIHAGISDFHTHFYGGLRLGSFIQSIRALKYGPYCDPSTFFQHLIKPLLYTSADRISRSEITQEANAIHAQRSFLKQFVSPSRDPGWKAKIKETYWGQLIDKYLAEGIGESASDSNSVEDVISHAFGDWIVQQIVEQPWHDRINPLDMPFRFHNPSKQNGFGETFTPDAVLACIANIPDDEIRGLDLATQRQVLINHVEEFFGEEVEYLITSDELETSQRNISTGEAFNRYRASLLESALQSDDWFAVPLYKDVYKGTVRSWETTLWDLLDGIVSETVLQDGQPVRRLWLESSYSHLIGSKLLSLAVQIWHIRYSVMLPIVRAYLRTVTANVQSHLTAAREIKNHSLQDSSFMREMESNPGYDFADQVRKLHEQTPVLRDRYESVLSELATLGEAILNHEGETISSYY